MDGGGLRGEGRDGGMDGDGWRGGARAPGKVSKHGLTPGVEDKHNHRASSSCLDTYGPTSLREASRSPRALSLCPGQV